MKEEICQFKLIMGVFTIELLGKLTSKSLISTTTYRFSLMVCGKLKNLMLSSQSREFTI